MTKYVKTEKRRKWKWEVIGNAEMWFLESAPSIGQSPLLSVGFFDLLTHLKDFKLCFFSGASSSRNPKSLPIPALFNLSDAVCSLHVLPADFEGYTEEKLLNFIKTAVVPDSEFGDKVEEVQQKIVDYYARSNEPTAKDYKFWLERYTQVFCLFLTGFQSTSTLITMIIVFECQMARVYKIYKIKKKLNFWKLLFFRKRH